MFKILVSLFICLISSLVSVGVVDAFGASAKGKTPADYEVKLGGNAYITKGSGARIDGIGGLVNWYGKAIVTTYFRVDEAPQEVSISLRARGHSTIGVHVNGKTTWVKLDSDEFQDYEVGNFNFAEPGYQQIHVRGKDKEGRAFGEISSIFVKGVRGNVNFVRNFESYWGRRGPSVHMRYILPKDVEIEYFYNEVTVPVGEDAMHTYFMLNGFGEGYCGIQVNSPSERRVLFSVWSPFSTDNPRAIPEDQRVVKLRQGKGVHIGEFGNEGSGGQSFLRHMWKAGTTYKILTRVRPDGKGNTDYTAYFFDPDEGEWRLIASFRRPKTNTWYRGAHSFLENFNPEQGFVSRKVLFGNQWARDNKGNWYELTHGQFTCDGTGNARVRMDYTGGVSDDGKGFFLKNCGFFNENTRTGTFFKRKPSGKKAPVINFDDLEKL